MINPLTTNGIEEKQEDEKEQSLINTIGKGNLGEPSAPPVTPETQPVETQPTTPVVEEPVVTPEEPEVKSDIMPTLTEETPEVAPEEPEVTLKETSSTPTLDSIFSKETKTPLEVALETMKQESPDLLQEALRNNARIKKEKDEKNAVIARILTKQAKPEDVGKAMEAEVASRNETLDVIKWINKNAKDITTQGAIPFAMSNLASRYDLSPSETLTTADVISASVFNGLAFMLDIPAGATLQGAYHLNKGLMALGYSDEENQELLGNLYNDYGRAFRNGADYYIGSREKQMKRLEDIVSEDTGEIIVDVGEGLGMSFTLGAGLARYGYAQAAKPGGAVNAALIPYMENLGGTQVAEGLATFAGEYTEEQVEKMGMEEDGIGAILANLFVSMAAGRPADLIAGATPEELGKAAQERGILLDDSTPDVDLNSAVSLATGVPTFLLRKSLTALPTVRMINKVIGENANLSSFVSDQFLVGVQGQELIRKVYRDLPQDKKNHIDAMIKFGDANGLELSIYDMIDHPSINRMYKDVFALDPQYHINRVENNQKKLQEILGRNLAGSEYEALKDEAHKALSEYNSSIDKIYSQESVLIKEEAEARKAKAKAIYDQKKADINQRKDILIQEQKEKTSRALDRIEGDKTLAQSAAIRPLKEQETADIQEIEKGTAESIDVLKKETAEQEQTLKTTASSLEEQLSLDMESELARILDEKHTAVRDYLKQSGGLEQSGKEFQEASAQLLKDIEGPLSDKFDKALDDFKVSIPLTEIGRALDIKEEQIDSLFGFDEELVPLISRIVKTSKITEGNKVVRGGAVEEPEVKPVEEPEVKPETTKVLTANRRDTYNTLIGLRKARAKLNTTDPLFKEKSTALDRAISNLDSLVGNYVGDKGIRALNDARESWKQSYAERYLNVPNISKLANTGTYQQFLRNGEEEFNAIMTSKARESNIGAFLRLVDITKRDLENLGIDSSGRTPEDLEDFLRKQMETEEAGKGVAGYHEELMVASEVAKLKFRKHFVNLAVNEALKSKEDPFKKVQEFYNAHADVALKLGIDKGIDPFEVLKSSHELEQVFRGIRDINLGSKLQQKMLETEGKTKALSESTEKQKMRIQEKLEEDIKAIQEQRDTAIANLGIQKTSDIADIETRAELDIEERKLEVAEGFRDLKTTESLAKDEEISRIEREADDRIAEAVKQKDEALLLVETDTSQGLSIIEGFKKEETLALPKSDKGTYVFSSYINTLLEDPAEVDKLVNVLNNPKALSDMGITKEGLQDAILDSVLKKHSDMDRHDNLVNAEISRTLGESGNKLEKLLGKETIENLRRYNQAVDITARSRELKGPSTGNIGTEPEQTGLGKTLARIFSDNLAIGKRGVSRGYIYTLRIGQMVGGLSRKGHADLYRLAIKNPEMFKELATTYGGKKLNLQQVDRLRLMLATMGVRINPEDEQDRQEMRRDLRLSTFTLKQLDEMQLEELLEIDKEQPQSDEEQP